MFFYWLEHNRHVTIGVDEREASKIIQHVVVVVDNEMRVIRDTTRKSARTLLPVWNHRNAIVEEQLVPLF